MKVRIYLGYGLLIFTLTAAFVIHEAGNAGMLPGGFLPSAVYSWTQRIESPITDLKFRLRGTQNPLAKIVIVAIDEKSLALFERWPWRRDYVGILLQRILDLGAKGIVLDVIFADRIRSVPEELEEELVRKGMRTQLERVDFDSHLANFVRAHQNRFVLGWHGNRPCRPRYSSPIFCPLPTPEESKGATTRLPDRLAISIVSGRKIPEDVSPLMMAVDPLVSYASLNSVTMSSGFVDDFRDSDEVDRRAGLVMSYAGRLYPSLALAGAALAMDEEIVADTNSRGEMESLRWKKSDREIPVTGSGMMGVNFLGSEGRFPRVSAVDILKIPPNYRPSDNANGERRELAEKEPRVLPDLKGALVLFGATARILGDLHFTPFSRRTPAVEVQATIIDNLLNSRAIVESTAFNIFIFLIMIAGLSFYVLLTRRLEKRSVYLIFAAGLLLFAFFDYQVFAHLNCNMASGFFYWEFLTVNFLVVGEKFTAEGKKKRFIRGIFGRNISAETLRTLSKKPRKLSLNVKRQTLTLLYCEVRDFNVFAERLEAKAVGTFLNDFHSIVTEAILEQGGTIDKFMGDIVSAFWGAPLPTKEHSLRACRAAKTIIRLVNKRQEEWEKKYGIEVNVGIGLNTGSVNVGNMGSNENLTYSIVGENVNLTKRIEAATKHFGVAIMVSQSTFDSINEAGLVVPDSRNLGSIRVKGRTQPVLVCELLHQPMDPDALQQFEKGIRHFGRKELSSAEGCLNKARDLFVNLGMVDRPTELYLAITRRLLSKTGSDEFQGSIDINEK